MILRKPYAFFIKYFRVINIILAVLMAVLIYQTVIIGKFLTDYIADYNVADNLVISNYISFYSFLLCLLVVILTIVITSVMFVKNKPKKLYIFTFVVSVVLLILYAFDYNIMRSMQEAVLDIRISKVSRDITYLVIGLQIVSFIITAVRATGFDLKSFEFGKDLQELDIDTKDNEEFEVAVEVDRNKARRTFRNKIRNLNYFYFEHKFLINLGALIFVVIIAFAILINTLTYSSIYGEGRIFSVSGMQFNIEKTYITDTDQIGDGIVDTDDMLVVVKMNVRKLSSNAEQILNTGLVTLKVGNKFYGKTMKYNKFLTDIGTGYVNQKLSDEFVSYILVFEVPSEDIEKSMRLKVNDNVSYIRGEIGVKNNFIRLKPIKLTDVKTKEDSHLGDAVSFSDSVLGETTLKINKFEVANRFKTEYDYCYKKDKCIKSYKYITPSATGNYFKTLLKLDSEFELDENMKLNGIADVYDFLNNFGTIYYKIGNAAMIGEKIDSQKFSLQNNENNNSYYIEVNYDVSQANSIYLEFKVRNLVYKYVLK